jgi:hypothetical protein
VVQWRSDLFLRQFPLQREAAQRLIDSAPRGGSSHRRTAPASSEAPDAERGLHPNILDLEDPEISEVAESGERFFKIVDKRKMRSKTLWIRTKDFALIRYRQEEKFGGEVPDVLFDQLKEAIGNKTAMDSLHTSGLPSEIAAMIQMVADHSEMLNMLKDMNKLMPKELLEKTTTATLEKVQFDEEVDAKQFLQLPWKHENPCP